MDLTRVKVTGSTTRTVSGSFTGWECALRYRPAWPANVGLAVAPALWLCALWLRSTWARMIGAAFCALATVVQGTIAFTGPSEGVTQFREGYWVWLASSIVLTVAFSVLPEPVRPPPGEPLPPEVRALARARFAMAFAALATVSIALPQFVFTGYRGGMTIIAGGRQPATVQTANPYEVPGIVLALNDPPGAPIAAGLLALPFLFCAAALTRSLRLRVLGAAGAVALVVAQVLVRPRGYWNWWSGTVHPALVHWYLGPLAALVAFAMLPTGIPRVAAPPGARK